jgi:hypothetical protein
MSLFDNLGQNQQPNQQMNPMQMLQQNPANILNKAHWNAPQNMMGNPQQIVNHLVQSGQVPQSWLNAAIQKAQSMGIKLR